MEGCSYVEGVALAEVACFGVVAGYVDLVAEECSIGVDMEEIWRG